MIASSREQLAKRKAYSWMRSCKRHFTSTFWRGLVTILPVVVTMYLAVWIWWLAESNVGAIIKRSPFGDYYIPGLGFCLAVSILYLIGLSTRRWLGKKVIEKSDEIFRRIPILKSIYGMTRDLLAQFSERNASTRGTPVLVSLDPIPISVIGFMTKEAPPELIQKRIDIDLDHHALVYLPMSYQVGGFTALIPRSRLTKLDLTFEDAIRLVFTAGLSSAVREDDRC